MIFFSFIQLLFILFSGQGGAVKDAKAKHTILATNDKVYLAKLSKSKAEIPSVQNDYEGEKPEDDIQKTRQNTIRSEISGGEEALHNEFPWMVKLKMKCSPQVMLCGGSLISPRVVLSSFHCSCNFDYQGGHMNTRYEELNCVALLGAHNVNDQTYTTRKIIDVKFPPDQVPYNQLGLIPPDHHDFALFVLNEPVKFSLKISPICLPSQGQNFTGKAAIAAGWGLTETGNFSAVLKKVREVVGKTYWNKILTSSLAGPGHSTCLGDSGGPLMFKNATSYIIIGTLSTGPKGCGLTEEGLYNKVSDWVDWVKKEMDQLGEKADHKSCNKHGGQGSGLSNNTLLGNPDQHGGDLIEHVHGDVYKGITY